MIEIKYPEIYSKYFKHIIDNNFSVKYLLENGKKNVEIFINKHSGILDKIKEKVTELDGKDFMISGEFMNALFCGFTDKYITSGIGDIDVFYIEDKNKQKQSHKPNIASFKNIFNNAENIAYNNMLIDTENIEIFSIPVSVQYILSRYEDFMHTLESFDTTSNMIGLVYNSNTDNWEILMDPRYLNIYLDRFYTLNDMNFTSALRDIRKLTSMYRYHPIYHLFNNKNEVKIKLLRYKEIFGILSGYYAERTGFKHQAIAYLPRISSKIVSNQTRKNLTALEDIYSYLELMPLSFISNGINIAFEPINDLNKLKILKKEIVEQILNYFIDAFNNDYTVNTITHDENIHDVIYLLLYWSDDDRFEILKKIFDYLIDKFTKYINIGDIFRKPKNASFFNALEHAMHAKKFIYFNDDEITIEKLVHAYLIKDMLTHYNRKKISYKYFEPVEHHDVFLSFVKKLKQVKELKHYVKDIEYNIFNHEISRALFNDIYDLKYDFIFTFLYQTKELLLDDESYKNYVNLLKGIDERFATFYGTNEALYVRKTDFFNNEVKYFKIEIIENKIKISEHDIRSENTASTIERFITLLEKSYKAYH